MLEIHFQGPQLTLSFPWEDARRIPLEPPTGDSRVILRANFGLLLNALVDLGEGLKGEGGGSPYFG